MRPNEDNSQDYTTGVVNELLQGVVRYKDVQLSVDSADPPNLPVRVTGLTEQVVPVRVLDEQDKELSLENLSIKAYALPGQPPQAVVRLTNDQLRLSRQGPVIVNARLEKPNRTNKDYPVEIQLPESSGSLPTDTIAQPQVGYLMPFSMQGKYRVVLDESELDDYKPIEVEADSTTLAKYKNSPFQLVLDVYERDQHSKTVNRALRYFHLSDYGHIKILNQVTTTVRFHLEEISPTDRTVGGVGQ